MAHESNIQDIPTGFLPGPAGGTRPVTGLADFPVPRNLQKRQKGVAAAAQPAAGRHGTAATAAVHGRAC